jgi:DNA polymerase-1
MLSVDRWLRDEGRDTKMIMQVHDELVFEVASGDVAAVSEKICQLMSGAAELAVPLLVEAGSGDNWDEAH